MTYTLDGFLHWIRHTNTNYRQHLLPFVCAGKQVGFCKPSFAKQLEEHSSVFEVTDQKVSIKAEFDSQEKRTAAVAGVLDKFRKQGLISGWRDELYPVKDSFHDEPHLLIERAAAVPFGIRSYGVHVNGFTATEEGLKLWVARRSKSKPTWPGKLDHICAGGQPFGISPIENVIKECAEEASIPRDLAEKAVPVGAVSYAQMQEAGVKRDCLFCFDLHLPSTFQPVPGDSEVESFELMPIQQVAQIISHTDNFKDNCNLVIVDFLIRHGVLSPECPGYLELVSGLRQEECV